MCVSERDRDKEREREMLPFRHIGFLITLSNLTVVLIVDVLDLFVGPNLFFFTTSGRLECFFFLATVDTTVLVVVSDFEYSVPSLFQEVCYLIMLDGNAPFRIAINIYIFQYTYELYGRRNVWIFALTVELNFVD